MIWEKKIIVRGKRDQLSGRVPESDVSIRVAKVRRFREVVPTDPLITETRDDLRGVVGAPVADDKQLEITLGLLQDRSDRVADHVGPVVRRHEHADAWHAYQPATSPNE